MTTSAITEGRDAGIGRGTTLARALDWDLAQPLTFAALALAFVLSRAPFLDLGYGTDPDAWRIALTGHWLWDNGEYYPSRLPGYPVPELGYALVIQGGWIATNLLTVAVSLGGLWFFARIVTLLRLTNRALLVVGFAFTPLLWINSVTTMDYMWALTGLLGAYYFVLLRQNLAAALLLGFAAASRSTSLLMLLPFAVYLWRDGQRAEIRPFISSTLAVTILAYAPIAWRYGPQFIDFYDTKVWYLQVLRLLGKDCLGLIGAMGVIAAAAVSLPRLTRLPSDVWRDKQVMFWVIVIALTAITFARLPHEAAYLIPLYPFGFFLMARYFRTWALAGAIAAVVLAGFVDLTSPGDEIDSEAFTNAQLGRGLLLSNRETMRAQMAYTRDLAALEAPERTVLITGFVYPQLAVLEHDRLELGILEKDKSSISQLSDKGQATDPQRQLIYVWLLDYDDFERFREEGYSFMYTQDGGRSTAALYDYRPSIYGARLIDLGRAPSGGSGAARTDR
ncbi:MAG: hypothetical protein WEC75_14515 [Dehalococcoidia bacterium]